MFFRANRNAPRAVIFALIACVSCDHLVDPPLPPDTARFVPPAVYARWWAMVESCSGFNRSLADVEWYSAPGRLTNPNNGEEAVEGYYSRASNRIVLRMNDTIAGGTVRHEMLHALLRVGSHPRSAFLQSCGGVVDCGEDCMRDAGPVTTPDAAMPRVAPSKLEVSSAVSPASPGSSIDGGLFTFTVTVRNPFAYPVVAVLPPRRLGGPAISYPYDIRAIDGGGSGGGDLALDSAITYFAAGETKRDVFDFTVAPIGFVPNGFSSWPGFPGMGIDGIAFNPGTYRFRGGYGDHMASDLNVVLNP
jgi:hypothetical protein